MAYITILNVGSVRLSMAEPAMYLGPNLQYNLSVPYGCKVELYNNNSENVTVDIYAYQSGGSSSDAFAATSCTVINKSYTYMDYSRLFADFLAKLGATNAPVVIEMQVFKQESQTTHTGAVQVFAANYDITHTDYDNILPERITLLRAAIASVGCINRITSSVRFSVIKTAGNPVSYSLGSLNLASAQFPASTISRLTLRLGDSEKVVVIDHVDECAQYAQLQWTSRRDGFEKSYAFKILSNNSGGGDSLQVFNNLNGRTMKKRNVVLTLCIPSASYAQWLYVEDLNYSHDIRILTRRGESAAFYDAVTPVRIVSDIPQHSLTAYEDIRFEIGIESEVAQW